MRCRDEVWRQWEPVGIAEEMHAELVLVAYWRLRRVIVAEGGVLTQRVAGVLGRLMETRRASAAAQHDRAVGAGGGGAECREVAVGGGCGAGGAV